MLCSIPGLHVSLPHWSQGWVCVAVRAWHPWLQQQHYRPWLLKHTVCQNPSLVQTWFLKELCVFNPWLWPVVASNHAIGSPNSVTPKCVETADQKKSGSKTDCFVVRNWVAECPLKQKQRKQTQWMSKTFSQWKLPPLNVHGIDHTKSKLSTCIHIYIYIHIFIYIYIYKTHPYI